jgi:hypothetical protein
MEIFDRPVAARASILVQPNTGEAGISCRYERDWRYFAAKHQRLRERRMVHRRMHILQNVYIADVARSASWDRGRSLKLGCKHLFLRRAIISAV